MTGWLLPVIAAGLLATRGGRPDAASAVAIAAAGLWASRHAATWDRMRGAAWPAAAWLGWSLLGVAVAPDPRRSLFAWAHLCGLTAVAVLAAQLESRPDASAGFGRTAARRWMIVAVGSACVVAVCSLAGLDLLAGKNLTGAFLLLGAALACGLIVAERQLPGGRWRLPVGGVLILAGLLWTRSVGAWMGGGVAAATWAVARWRWRGVAGLAVALLAGVALLPSSTRDALALGNPDDPYSRVRSVLWRTAARTSLDHPLFGVGLDHFGTTPEIAAPVIPGTPVRRLKWTPFAHSEILQVVVESGWPAAAALAWLMALMARAGWRQLSDPIPSPTRVAASLAAIAGLAHSLVDFTLHLPLVAATVAASAGVMLAEPPRPEPGWRPAGWGVIFPVTMILAALSAGLGFHGSSASRYDPQSMARQLLWPAVARFSEGEDALARGRWAEAEADFHAALREEPRLARAQFRLAEVAAARGDRPLALRRRRIAQAMLTSNFALRRTIRYASEGYGGWVLGE